MTEHESIIISICPLTQFQWACYVFNYKSIEPISWCPNLVKEKLIRAEGENLKVKKYESEICYEYYIVESMCS